jgi:L-fuculose-phosphate aldolase
MLIGKENKLRREIIDIGKRLYSLRLVVASSGNLSARMDRGNILITATATSLGNLKNSDILKIDIERAQELKGKPVTTEFPLHSLIYKNLAHNFIIHCHPPLINAYFAIYPDIKALTFESKLYLGNIPVVEQDTPAVTKPEFVIEALKLNNLVVLKHHGVISAGNSFKQALNLIETLEEAVRIISLARLFDKKILDDLDKELKENLVSENVYPMFSKEHIQAIVDLVNKDDFITKKGKESDLTLKLAIKLDGSHEQYKFNFEKGKIVRLDFDSDAPFLISAPREVWELVFLGKFDPFVAVTQGKMKLTGQIGQLSRWYVPFSRLFELFRQVKFK